MYRSILVGLLVAYLCGTAAQFLLPWGISIPVFLFLTGLSLGVVWASRRSAAILFVALCFLISALGAERVVVAEKARQEDPLASLIGSRVTATGVVSRDVDRREEHALITVALETVRAADGAQVSLKERAVLASVPFYPEVRYGDRVALSGILEVPLPFENEMTGALFRYDYYLAKDGVYYRMSLPRMTVLSHGNGNRLKEALFRWKHALVDSLDRLVPAPESSLLGGILLGAQSSLGEDLIRKFRDTGIVHIVVLSGYNVTIIADTIMRVLSAFPRALSLSLGAGGIAFFAIMTGGTATVVRASLMALLAIVARATGRVYQVTIALLLAALIMMFENPYLALFDPSFQLSFLATLGLLYVAPLCERLVPFLPGAFGIRQIGAATLGTQALVLPLLLFIGGSVSLIAPVVNVLILPVIPLTMLLGSLAAFCGLILPFLGLLFAIPVSILLAYILSIVKIGAAIPYAGVSFGGISAEFMLAAYVIIAYVLYRIYRNVLQSSAR